MIKGIVIFVDYFLWLLFVRWCWWARLKHDRVQRCLCCWGRTWYDSDLHHLGYCCRSSISSRIALQEKLIVATPCNLSLS